MNEKQNMEGVVRELSIAGAFLREAIRWMDATDEPDARLYCLRALIRFHGCLGRVHIGLEKTLVEQAEHK